MMRREGPAARQARRYAEGRFQPDHGGRPVEEMSAAVVTLSGDEQRAAWEKLRCHPPASKYDVVWQNAFLRVVLAPGNPHQAEAWAVLRDAQLASHQLMSILMGEGIEPAIQTAAWEKFTAPTWRRTVARTKTLVTVAVRSRLGWVADLALLELGKGHLSPAAVAVVREVRDCLVALGLNRADVGLDQVLASRGIASLSRRRRAAKRLDDLSVTGLLLVMLLDEFAVSGMAAKKLAVQALPGFDELISLYRYR